MLIERTPGTDTLAATLVELLTNGVPYYGLAPLFPGIPVVEDQDDEATLAAPYILLDLTDPPVEWGGTTLYAHPVTITLVQPVAIPDVGTVSLDYDSDAVGSYETALTDLIFERWSIDVTTPNQEDRTTYRVLSDWLQLAANVLGNDLQFADCESYHRFGSPDPCGRPKRDKQPITTEHVLIITLGIVCGVLVE